MFPLSAGALVPDFGIAANKVAQGNDSRFPANICASGNKMRWDGSTWQCEADFATDSSKVAKSGDSMSGPLSVAGLVESTSGGFKFPDGTVQTTAVTTTSLKLSKSTAQPFTCDGAKEGELALTAFYKTCVCNGSLWVSTNDGTTPCIWAPITVVSSGAGRKWSDGSYASSCKSYKNPNGAYTYAGTTGDGVYTIDPDGAGPTSPTDVFCDMTTSGGGWTYLISTVASGLSPLVLGANVNFSTNVNGCGSPTMGLDPINGYNLYHNYTCGDSARYVQYQFTWTNSLAATELLVAGVSAGNSPVFQVNGSNFSVRSNAKNLFAVDYNCGTNGCWQYAAVGGGAPATTTFSGNLTILMYGYSDAGSWGGNIGLWIVGVR